MKVKAFAAALLLVPVVLLSSCADEKDRPRAAGKHEIGSYSLDLSPLAVPLLPAQTALVVPAKEEFWSFATLLDDTTYYDLLAITRLEPFGFLTFQGSFLNRLADTRSLGLYTGDERTSRESLGRHNATVTMEPGQVAEFGPDGGFDEAPYLVTRHMNLPSPQIWVGLVNDETKDVVVDTADLALATSPVASLTVPFPEDAGLRDRNELKPTRAVLTGMLRNLTAGPVFFRLEFEGEIRYASEVLARPAYFLFGAYLQPGEERVLNEDVAQTFHSALRFFDFYGREGGRAFYRVTATGPEAAPAIEVLDLVLSYEAEKAEADNAGQPDV